MVQSYSLGCASVHPIYSTPQSASSPCRFSSCWDALSTSTVRHVLGRPLWKSLFTGMMKPRAKKAIVDHTSPALCTPITLFPTDIEWSFLQRTRYNALHCQGGGKPPKLPFPFGFRHPGWGPSHDHRKHAQKFGKYRAYCSGDILADRQTDALTHRRAHYNVAPEIYWRTDRQTHWHTDITIFRHRSRGRSSKRKKTKKRKENLTNLTKEIRIKQY